MRCTPLFPQCVETGLTFCRYGLIQVRLRFRDGVSVHCTAGIPGLPEAPEVTFRHRRPESQKLMDFGTVSELTVSTYGCET